MNLNKRINELLKPNSVLNADTFTPEIKRLVADCIKAVIPEPFQQSEKYLRGYNKALYDVEAKAKKLLEGK